MAPAPDVAFRPRATTVCKVAHLNKTHALVLLSETTTDMVDEALMTVADATPNPAKLQAALYERRLAMMCGDLPQALWLLRSAAGFVGWVGWAPYKERPGCWQTTTYFSADSKGIGLYKHARCYQLHAADIVAAWADSRGLPPVMFMSSIADWNYRSLCASRHYAASHGWPDTWEHIFEPLAVRKAYVFTFPFPDAPHSCYQRPGVTYAALPGNG